VLASTLIAMDQLSPVHEIVNALWRALHDLGSRATTREIEHWGFSIHAALSADGREFHNHDHVIEIASEGDPMEVIAALYHDAIYIQVDQGPPRSLRPWMEGLLGHEAEGWRVLPGAAANEALGDVLAVFGKTVGDVVAPMGGLNELSSALVAIAQLQDALDREQRVAVAACIEQTIPFREDCVPKLRGRIAQLGYAGDKLEEIVKRAVRLGNRDVQNFAENDPGRFLDNTWKLLPESNPVLHSPLVYTVTDYRKALQKMEGFLAWLPPERVFHTWGDEPSAAVHARRVARTAGNLELAVRYLRAKLYSIALVEAIAEISGGDVPIDFFMGGTKQTVRMSTDAGPVMKRIEQFLPRLANATELDSPLQKLLAEGRASESSFDTGPSPLGAFLHATVGEAAMMKGVAGARKWWGGGSTAEEFLVEQPRAPVVAIARAAANIIDTRRDALFTFAERLERMTG